NIDDGDIFIGEFEGGALCSVQSSFVTVGNYPGIEVRVYGSEGALIARLVAEFGAMEPLRGAKPDAVESVDVEVPERPVLPRADGCVQAPAELRDSGLCSSRQLELHRVADDRPRRDDVHRVAVEREGPAHDEARRVDALRVAGTGTQDDLRRCRVA